MLAFRIFIYILIGSLGYNDEQIKRRLNYAMNHGFSKFKIKVGKSLEDDKRRLTLIRDVIGWDRELVGIQSILNLTYRKSIRRNSCNVKMGGRG